MLPRSFSAVLPAARKKDAAAARAALSNKKGCVIIPFLTVEMKRKCHRPLKSAAIGTSCLILEI